MAEQEALQPCLPQRKRFGPIRNRTSDGFGVLEDPASAEIRCRHNAGYGPRGRSQPPAKGSVCRNEHLFCSSGRRDGAAKWLRQHCVRRLLSGYCCMFRCRTRQRLAGCVAHDHPVPRQQRLGRLGSGVRKWYKASRILDMQGNALVIAVKAVKMVKMVKTVVSVCGVGGTQERSKQSRHDHAAHSIRHGGSNSKIKLRRMYIRVGSTYARLDYITIRQEPCDHPTAPPMP